MTMNMMTPPEWDLLLSYSQKNMPDKVRYLIEQKGVSPSHANRVGQSALHVASLWGHVECVKILIESGADLHAANIITGATPLHCAIQSSKASPDKQLETVQLLLQAGADPGKTDSHGNIPIDFLELQNYSGPVNNTVNEALRKLLEPKMAGIFGAIEANDAERLQRILLDDPSQASTRHKHETPLNMIVNRLIEGDSKDVALLEVFLKHGDTSHATDADGNILDETLLLHEICVALKESLYREKDDDKSRVLQSAAKLLIQCTTSEDGMTYTINTAFLLHDAARRNYLEMAKFLLDVVKVDPNTKGRQGMTPLQFAARSGRKEMVLFLLENYAIDVTIQDDRGQTALGAAKVNEKAEIVELLENYMNKTDG